MRKFDLSVIIQSFSVKPNGAMALFLGAGASVSSGLPSGGQIVWALKRKIYCVENQISESAFSDLSAKTHQEVIQRYFDDKGDCPAKHSPEEYSFYFEKCFPSSTDRELFLKEKVRDANPSIGYLSLAALILSKRVNTIVTTNFDNLVEAGTQKLQPGVSVQILSSTLRSNSPDPTDEIFPVVIKLHGDFRYDRLKNTPKELRVLEEEIQSTFVARMKDKCLFVFGYSGNDGSVMETISDIIKQGGLPYGLVWFYQKGQTLSEKATQLMELACTRNSGSGIVEIEDFDDAMHQLYISMGIKSPYIEENWKAPNRRENISFSSGRSVNMFVRTNSFEAITVPRSYYSFETDLNTWKELREVSAGKAIVSGYYRHKVAAFANLDELKLAFSGHIIGNISEEVIERYEENSAMVGLLYDLIGENMRRRGLIRYKKNKYFDQKTRFKDAENNCFEAIEISITQIEERVVLTVLPTVHVLSSNGTELSEEEYTIQINKIIGYRHNKDYNERIRSWVQKLIMDGNLSFAIDKFALSFNKISYSFGGGNNRQECWPTLPCYHYPEPKMQFSVDDSEKSSINQLKGLIAYGPIDKSYSVSPVSSSIRLALLAPQNEANMIISHLSKLKNHNQPITEKEFLPEYIGFENIYRRAIDIPGLSDSSRVILYNGDKALKLTPLDFYLGITRYIDRLAINAPQFDILIVYIPTSFVAMRELKEGRTYFDLHDSLKLYCASKNIVLQMIEEKSTVYRDQAKVMWALSTGLYAKASGQLWKPNIYDNNAAFVGLSYAQATLEGKGCSIGCSQLFDATGNGMQLLLRPLKNPRIIHENPYMSYQDALYMFSNLKCMYYDSIPVNQLKRIVIHKTTPYTEEEIKGITEALSGVSDIELIQIQEFTTWRAIRFQGQNINSPDNYPIHRGTVIPLDEHSFLLWTHGSVMDDDLAGHNRNYYKNGRGIPAPLLIRRFFGKASGEILVREVLMLTKMNWNSGDSLYKILPVTLDFAKILSRMAKQESILYNQPYDFRYFM